MNLHEIKVKILNSDNQYVKSIGNRLYIIFTNVVHGKIRVILLYKPYIDDRRYIEKEYSDRLGKKPDLDNPKSFNEKNNWRKLYDRNPIYTSMVDKYMIKQVIKDKCGEGHSFPLLGVWDDARQIDFASLPEKFVLKANHAGGVIVCRDKSSFDKEKAVKELRRQQAANYYWSNREWPYKNVERKIIAEAYMGENLTDYKNYCFNGKLQYTFVWSNESRADGRKPEAFFCGAYDRQWNRTELSIDYPTKNISYPKPECYEEMVSLAEKMSEGIPFVRVDCYCINGIPYVGEMTFFPWGGFMKFKDPKWDRQLGDLLKLDRGT